MVFLIRFPGRKICQCAQTPKRWAGPARGTRTYRLYQKNHAKLFKFLHYTRALLQKGREPGNSERLVHLLCFAELATDFSPGKLYSSGASDRTQESWLLAPLLHHMKADEGKRQCANEITDVCGRVISKEKLC
ncbi:hypothetical protein KIL84_005563 [Mauremys mutica]|uniref:Uncharacterized protein n=1 Tax=Mauremys mutica TaxID=74926 RepID=A0A9D3XHM9_9SAUR|nr:hypothetical protein KIL84_005563 [Mauremys mutica]